MIFHQNGLREGQWKALSVDQVLPSQFCSLSSEDAGETGCESKEEAGAAVLLGVFLLLPSPSWPCFVASLTDCILLPSPLCSLCSFLSLGSSGHQGDFGKFLLVPQCLGKSPPSVLALW